LKEKVLSKEAKTTDGKKITQDKVKSIPKNCPKSGEKEEKHFQRVDKQGDLSSQTFFLILKVMQTAKSIYGEQKIQTKVTLF
jgi:hypothetical protein